MKFLTQNAIEILQDLYLLRNDKGLVIETPDRLFKWVADHISSYEKYHDLTQKY